MKIYISCDSKKLIKKNYKDIIDKNTAIVDVPMIAELIRYEDYNGDICADFVLTQEIEKKLKNVYESKRFNKILYLVDNLLNPGFVSNFRLYVERHDIYFTEYTLIDYTQRLDPKVYKHFNNVI